MSFEAILSGVLGVGVTLIVKPAAKAVFGVDSKITSAIKAVQPAIALGLGLVLPRVCGFIGIGESCPTGEALVQAPLGTVAGITLLELKRKLLPSFNG